MDDLFDVLNSLYVLISGAIPVLIGLGALLFVWGLVVFVLNTSRGNEDGIENGKRLMIWGIIALFVMVSVWGLVGVLNQFTGIEQGGTPPDIPLLPEFP